MIVRLVVSRARCKQEGKIVARTRFQGVVPGRVADREAERIPALGKIEDLIYQVKVVKKPC